MFVVVSGVVVGFIVVGGASVGVVVGVVASVVVRPVVAGADVVVVDDFFYTMN